MTEEMEIKDRQGKGTGKMRVKRWKPVMKVDRKWRGYINVGLGERLSMKKWVLVEDPNG